MKEITQPVIENTLHNNPRKDGLTHVRLTNFNKATFDTFDICV